MQLIHFARGNQTKKNRYVTKQIYMVVAGGSLDFTDEERENMESVRG